MTDMTDMTDMTITQALILSSHEMTLCGACSAFECVINVITSESSNWFLQYWPKDGNNEDKVANASGAAAAKKAKEIFIGYTFPLHYDAIKGRGVQDFTDGL